MNYCIYLKDTEPTLSFRSAEHIFPAGLGGIQKLPAEFVSYDCNNNIFSDMERDFMRHSLLALPRQFYGPGKRGKLNVRYATKSQIGLIKYEDEDELDEVYLGYIKLGQPFLIRQLRINTNGDLIMCTGSQFNNIDQLIENFNHKLRSFEGRYTMHTDSRIASNEFIIGIEDDEPRWHICLSNEQLIPQIENLITNILNRGGVPATNSEHKSAQVQSEQSLRFSDTDLRVCAKMAFNFLAFVKGREFVLDEQFDHIREWMINGGENRFATLTGKQSFKGKYPFTYLPELAHIIMINQDRNHLTAIMSFYGGHFETAIKLSNQFNGVFGMDGFICDWKNRSELRFMDLVSKANESLNT